MPGTAWPNPDLQSRPTARITHGPVTLEADERPPCPWLWDQQGQGSSPGMHSSCQGTASLSADP